MIVVKVGGGSGIDVGAVCDDVAAMWNEGREVVMVHGASDETNRVAEALGHPPRFVTSPSGHESRFTDRHTLEIFEMVYCGRANKAIVERLQLAGVNAVGLSGIDGRLFEGRRKSTVRAVENGKTKLLRGDWTGTVERVNVRLLRLLLADAYLPVLSPPGWSAEGAINVDGDRAAAAVAQALGAEALVVLSNVPGLLRDPADETTCVPWVDADAASEAAGFARGRMKRKVLAATDAVAGGVHRAVLADARLDAPVRAALDGYGTVVSHGPRPPAPGPDGPGSPPSPEEAS